MKRAIFIPVIALTLLASCKETPTNDMSPTIQKEIQKDNKADVITTQDSLQMARKRTMDSLEQIKSHGHAH